MKMMRRFLLAALAAVAALPADAAPVRYGLTLAGLPLGVLTLDGDRSDDHYEAAVRFESAGLAGLLDYGLEGTAEGLAGRGRDLLPLRFAGASHSPRAVRQTRIEWIDGAPAFVAVDPPRGEAVAPATAAGALDPASALLRLAGPRPAAEACSESVAVFDGSRLVRLTLGAPAPVADGIACDGTYLRLGGEPLTPIDPPECPFRLVYRIAADGRAVLQQIRVPTRFGEALIERRVSLTEMNSRLTSTH